MRKSFVKPELLVPAGSEEIFYDVIKAGADAVYLAGKVFSVRRDNRDFSFCDEAMTRVVKFAHENKRKVYVAVNSLVGNREIDQLVTYLKFLSEIKVDALIVQDQAVVKICHEHDISLPLHASNMMNVNSVEYAWFLKTHGFARIVTSRDLSLGEIRRISDDAEVDVEYFIHGNKVAVSQVSDVLKSIGDSKSDQWIENIYGENADELLAEDYNEPAMDDLCVIEQIPDLVNARVHCLKIEGRMKPSSVLIPIVESYRKALDCYYDNPLNYHSQFIEVQNQYRKRVRDYSAGLKSFEEDKKSSDINNEKDPHFLSFVNDVAVIEDWKCDPFAEIAPDCQISSDCVPEISCVVGTIATAKAALKSGVDNLIISWEGDLKIDSGWDMEDIRALSRQCKEAGVTLVMSSPKVLTERELHEFYLAVDSLECIKDWQVSGMAPVKFLQRRHRNIWADYDCNVTNVKAAEFLFDHDVRHICPSLEATFEDVRELIEALPGIRFELPIHGVVTSILEEHYLIGMQSRNIGKKDALLMPLKLEGVMSEDLANQTRRVFTDKYYRNHIMMDQDLSMLPALLSFLRLGAASFRIDARVYDAEKTSQLVTLYKNAVQKPEKLEQIIGEFCAGNSEQFNLGGYGKK